MKKCKVIALIGESGSGKDTVKSEILKRYPNKFYNVVNYTTRPLREGEVDGVDYHFISGEDFGQMVLKNEMIEAACFNDWFYGTGTGSFSQDKINIGCFNPEGVETLSLYQKSIDLKIYWLRTPDATRLIRNLSREPNPDVDEIIRRYKADKFDFLDINFNNLKELENKTYEDMDKAIELITKECANW